MEGRAWLQAGTLKVSIRGAAALLGAPHSSHDRARALEARAVAVERDGTEALMVRVRVKVKLGLGCVESGGARLPLQMPLI